MANQSKEIKAILEAIKKFGDKYKNDFIFIGSFVAWKDGEVTNDSGNWMYGSKKNLLIELKKPIPSRTPLR